MQDRKREGCGLAGAGLGNADDVTAGEGEGNGLSLDRRGREIILFLEGTRDGIGEAEILKGGQKVGSFHYKRQAPGGDRQERARGCLETPACLGRRFWLAEGASQKPLDGLRTRGSQRPDDSQGRSAHMEHERGAFKVNRDLKRPRG